MIYKIVTLKDMVGARDITIEVDGGITTETAGAVFAAGATALVAGSAIFKGAGEEWYRRRLIEGLEKEFSTLKIKTGSFECVGVMHEQDPSTFEVWTHQHHYVPQIKEIPVDAKALVPDEEPADEDLSQLFMSLVGALAWLVLTMPCLLYTSDAADE